MRFGILADIHENLSHLRWSIDVLQNEGADRLVVLGDVFELGHRLKETVDLLTEAGAIGVWGNHDFGLCRDNPRPEDHRRYGEGVLTFMGGLRPRLEIDDCLLVHVEPWLNPEKIEDLWYFEGPPETPDQVARSFTAVPNRLIFVGHYHRWLLASPEGIQPWVGDRPIVLAAPHRYLVAVHAVCAGRCALFDAGTSQLIPFTVVTSWRVSQP
jgi:predicted phosphodiesterase